MATSVNDYDPTTTTLEQPPPYNRYLVFQGQTFCSDMFSEVSNVFFFPGVHFIFQVFKGYKNATVQKCTRSASPESGGGYDSPGVLHLRVLHLDS